MRLSNLVSGKARVIWGIEHETQTHVHFTLHHIPLWEVVPIAMVSFGCYIIHFQQTFIEYLLMSVSVPDTEIKERIP